MFVDCHFPPAVHNLHEAVHRLADLVQALVPLLVVSDPLLEVLQYFVLSQVGVVRAGSLYFLDVGLNDLVVVTDRLHEKQFEASTFNNFVIQKLSSFFGCVCSIENSNLEKNLK